MTRFWIADVIGSILLIVLAMTALRFASGNPLRRPRQDLLDLLVGGTLLLATALLTLRLASSSLLWTALAVGLALADHTKRQVLREPVVFADADELLQIFSHPHFYIPFAGPLAVYGGGSLLAIATIAFFLQEPPFLATDVTWARLCGLLLLLLPIAAYLHRPTLNKIARLLRGLHPSGDPIDDTSRFGTLACFALYAVLARAERPARREAARFGSVHADDQRPPIVIVQAESFFDLSRLYPEVEAALPRYTELKARAYRYGRLKVPAWGANTIRSEFAVLSGLSGAQLGLDRFNPYHAFARQRIDTLVWQLRLAGYLTVCVHPYDRRFYNRHLVMPKLGFEKFIGREAFPSEPGRYISDKTLAHFVNRLLVDEVRPIFVFAISVANHGPWDQDEPHLFSDPELAGYTEGIKDTDDMIGLLAEAPWMTDRHGLLVVYGDHQPSLRKLAKEADSDTDYIFLDYTAADRRAINLPVHNLGRLAVERLAERANPNVPFPALMRQ